MWSSIKPESLKCYLNRHLAVTDILHAIARLCKIYICAWVRRCQIFSKYMYVSSHMGHTLISTQFFFEIIRNGEWNFTPLKRTESCFLLLLLSLSHANTDIRTKLICLLVCQRPTRNQAHLLTKLIFYDSEVTHTAWPRNGKGSQISQSTLIQSYDFWGCTSAFNLANCENILIKFHDDD